MTGRVGVAISTTGDEHRLDLLAHSIAYWRGAAFQDPSNVGTVVVTIDGDDEACVRVIKEVGYEPVQFYRVGQSWGAGPYHDPREGHLGVAVNKNTGLELLMAQDVEHLFLSDDDTWPTNPASIDLHLATDLKHSMVCWGYHRLIESAHRYAEWSWPRGSMIYTHRSVVDRVGGMIEAFGPGGHEHVEWSRRIHQAGLTPALYPSPLVYAKGARGAMSAADYWHAEDMPLDGEGLGAYRMRKAVLTSVRRHDGDWENINKIMAERDGNPTFVPYRASENGRGSATLYHNR